MIRGLLPYDRRFRMTAVLSVTSALFCALCYLLPASAQKAAAPPPGNSIPIGASAPDVKANHSRWSLLMQNAVQSSNRNDYQDAIAKLQEILPEAKEDAPFEIQTLLLLANQYYAMVYNGYCADEQVVATLDKAIDTYNRAISLFDRLGHAKENDETRADTFFGKGLVEYQMGRMGGDGLSNFSNAKGDFGKAHAIFFRIHDDREAASCLKEQGIVETVQEDWNSALSPLNEALAIFRKLRDRDGMASCLYEMGIDQESVGRLSEALGDYQEALNIYKTDNNERGISSCENELGLVYYDLGDDGEDTGDYQRALEHFNKALSTIVHLNLHSDEASCRNDISLVYMSLGILSEASGRHEQATTAFGQATAELNTGLRLSKDRKDNAGAAYCKVNLGRLDYYQGRFSDSRAKYLEALTLFKDAQRPDQVQHCLANLAYTDVALGRLQDAANEYKQTIMAFEQFRTELFDAADVGQFDQIDNYGSYQGYAYLLTEQHKLSEAIVMAERGRAQGLAVKSVAANLLANLSIDDAKALHTRLSRLAQAGRALRASPSPSPAVLNEYENANREYVQFKESLLARDRYRRLNLIQGRTPPTYPQLANLASSHPDTLYLEWAMLDEKRSVLFALSQKDGLNAFNLPVGVVGIARSLGRARSDTMLGFGWLGAISTGSRTEERRGAATLYNDILGPAERVGLLASGRYKRLVLVPDGALVKLPFAALRDSHGRRLIERFPISVAISLGTLLWPTETRQNQLSMLCVADAGGATGEIFSAASAPAHRVDKSHAVTPPNNALLTGYAPLPQARKDAQRIAQMFPGAIGLAGSAAHEADVKRRMPGAAILHFATHGFLNSRNGLRSWLLLAPEPSDSSEDGRLEAREIAGMQLSARLAVLSCCETSLGQPGGGDGLLGPAWAFLAAGCPSVVGSLWNVYDAPTGDLMVRLYQNLKAGQPKDSALQAAMIAEMKATGHDSPLEWAGFQIVGNTSPLVKATR